MSVLLIRWILLLLLGGLGSSWGWAQESTNVQKENRLREVAIPFSLETPERAGLVEEWFLVVPSGTPEPELGRVGTPSRVIALQPLRRGDAELTLVVPSNTSLKLFGFGFRREQSIEDVNRWWQEGTLHNRADFFEVSDQFEVKLLSITKVYEQPKPEAVAPPPGMLEELVGPLIFYEVRAGQGSVIGLYQHLETERTIPPEPGSYRLLSFEWFFQKGPVLGAQLRQISVSNEFLITDAMTLEQWFLPDTYFQSQYDATVVTGSVAWRFYTGSLAIKPRLALGVVSYQVGYSFSLTNEETVSGAASGTSWDAFIELPLLWEFWEGWTLGVEGFVTTLKPRLRLPDQDVITHQFPLGYAVSIGYAW